MVQIKTNGRKLKEFRIKQGYSTIAFSQKIGVSKSTISAIEGNERGPSAAVAKKITDALGVGFDELFTIKEG